MRVMEITCAGDSVVFLLIIERKPVIVPRFLSRDKRGGELKNKCKSDFAEERRDATAFEI